MTKEEQLVSNYENSRRDRLRSVIADYLGDAGATAQFIVDEFKAELNDQLAFYRQKADVAGTAVSLLDDSHPSINTGTAGTMYPVTITPDDLAYQNHNGTYPISTGSTEGYPTPAYYVDGHSDVHVSVAETAAYPINYDTGLYGDVSIASSESNPYGFYDHDLGGPYYVAGAGNTATATYNVPPDVDYTNPNPGYASSEANPTGYYGTYDTGTQVAVASSESNPAGLYGAGGISPEQLGGSDSAEPYGKRGNFQQPPT